MNIIKNDNLYRNGGNCVLIHVVIAHEEKMPEYYYRKWNQEHFKGRNINELLISSVQVAIGLILNFPINIVRQKNVF